MCIYNYISIWYIHLVFFCLSTKGAEIWEKTSWLLFTVHLEKTYVQGGSFPQVGPKRTNTLSPTIMEVENLPNLSETHLEGIHHFPLPWLWEEESFKITRILTWKSSMQQTILKRLDCQIGVKLHGNHWTKITLKCRKTSICLDLQICAKWMIMGYH